MLWFWGLVWVVLCAEAEIEKLSDWLLMLLVITPSILIVEFAIAVFRWFNGNGWEMFAWGW